MIHDPMLRWVVTGLFVLTAAECGRAIVTERQPWPLVVNHGLHFVMAVAMAVMAWPWGAQLPTTGPAVFFLLAAFGFVTMAVIAARTTAQRRAYGYHGLMMLATAWMYAIMSGHLFHLRSSTQRAGEPDMPMPEMAAMNMPPSSGAPVWFSAVSWFGTVGFAVAVVFWTCRSFMERRREPARSRSLGNLGQAMMAAGMAVLFLATIRRV